MIKLKDDESIEDESVKLKKMLENLKADIPSLLVIEVGVNISSRPSAFNLVLTADFENEIGLNAYRIHPAHKEVLNYMESVVEKTAVVDYVQ